MKNRQHYDVGTYIVAGFIIGAMFGAVKDNIAQWAGIGMCLGIVVGSFISYKGGKKNEK